MTTIFVNNEPTTLADIPSPSLEVLLKQPGIVHCKTFAVALNREFIPKSRYREVMLNNGDQVEILMPMQGG